MSGISRGVKLFAVGFIVSFLLLWLVLNALHDRLIFIQKFQYIPLPGFLSVVRTPDVVLVFGPGFGDNDVSRFWWNERYLVVETETRPENLAKGDSPQVATFLIDLENIAYCELGPCPRSSEVPRKRVDEGFIFGNDQRRQLSPVRRQTNGSNARNTHPLS
jgi:hypothetical protein